MSVLNIRIDGSGSYKPKNIVFSAEIDEKLGFKKGYTKNLTGLNSRHYITNERACEMGAVAARQAIKAAAVELDDIDCIIAACGTMDQAIPCNAALIHKQLKPKNPIPAFDVNMTCLSHLMALQLAAGLFVSNTYKKILIVSSDIASVGLDWSDVQSAGIFGDGAAALVLTKGSNETGILAAEFKTYSEAAEFCQILGAGTYMPPSKITTNYESLCNFQMDGKKLYKFTAKILPTFIEQLFHKANVTMEEIDWVVPHQASQLALHHIQKKLSINDEKFINIYRNTGNQIAASIPTALDHLIRSRDIKRNDLILLLGTSAGLSVGGMVIRY